jgi:hypothetical protein
LDVTAKSARQAQGILQVDDILNTQANMLDISSKLDIIDTRNNQFN